MKKLIAVGVLFLSAWSGAQTMDLFDGTEASLRHILRDKYNANFTNLNDRLIEVRTLYDGIGTGEVSQAEFDSAISDQSETNTVLDTTKLDVSETNALIAAAVAAVPLSEAGSFTTTERNLLLQETGPPRRGLEYWLDAAGQSNALARVGDDASYVNSAYMDFDGVNDYITYSTNVPAPPVSGWSGWCWVEVGAAETGQAAILGKGHLWNPTTGHGGYGLKIDAAEVFTFNVTDETTAEAVNVSSGVTNSGGWHYIQFGYDGANAWIQVDDTPKVSSAANISTFDNNQIFLVGCAENEVDSIGFFCDMNLGPWYIPGIIGAAMAENVDWFSYDISGWGNHGTIAQNTTQPLRMRGAPVSYNAEYGCRPALHFDAINDAIVTPTTVETPKDYGIIYSRFVASGNTEYIIDAGTASDRFYMAEDTAGNIIFGIENAAIEDSPLSISAGELVEYELRMTPTDSYIYLNGVPVLTNGLYHRVAATTNALMSIGRRNTTGFYKTGEILEVRLNSEGYDQINYRAPFANDTDIKDDTRVFAGGTCVGETYRGQTHLHSDQSLIDGWRNDDTTNILNAYVSAGFDWVAPSEHNIAFVDPGGHGLLIVPNIETTDVGAMHFTQVGDGVNHYLADPVGQPELTAAHDAGAYITIAHPWEVDHYVSIDDLKDHFYWDSVEIFNGAWTNYNAGEHYLTALLDDGYRIHGIAVDDTHVTNDVGKGWVETDADYGLTTNGIIQALHDGAFYSTTGPVIDAVFGSGRSVYCDTALASTIEFIGQGGVVLASHAETTYAKYNATKSDTYIWVKITDDATGLQAWSNPFWLSDRTARDGIYEGNFKPKYTPSLANRKDAVDNLILSDYGDYQPVHNGFEGSIILTDGSTNTFADLYLNRGSKGPAVITTDNAGNVIHDVMNYERVQDSDMLDLFIGSYE